MIHSLLRPCPSNRRVGGRDLSASPTSTPGPRRETPRRRATADFTEADDDDDDEDTQEETMPGFVAADEDDEEGQDDDDDGNDPGQPTGRRTPLPVLPLFSSSHLGILGLSSS